MNLMKTEPSGLLTYPGPFQSPRRGSINAFTWLCGFVRFAITRYFHHNQDHCHFPLRLCCIFSGNGGLQALWGVWLRESWWRMQVAANHPGVGRVSRNMLLLAASVLSRFWHKSAGPVVILGYECVLQQSMWIARKNQREPAVGKFFQSLGL